MGIPARIGEQKYCTRGEIHISDDLNVFAVGDFGPRDRWNPNHLIATLGAWPLLRALALEPATLSALAERSHLSVDQAEQVLASLAELGVVRRSGNLLHLGFAWFTEADQCLIHASVARTAQDLADRILTRRDVIDQHLRALKASKWVGIEDLRFAVVGCFGLDWGGLDALKASGHLEHNKLQPGDRRYVMYVEEPVSRFQQKDYTGSHTMWNNERYQWTSFGDHSGRRFDLPDLVLHLRQAVAKSDQLPEASRAVLGDFVLDVIFTQLDAAGDELVRIAKGIQSPPATHPLLEAAQAAGKEKPAVPVFFWDHDGNSINQVVEIVQESVISIVSEQFDSLRAQMSDLTALRHGVPFTECFNPIWHALFGQVNRILSESGYSADPVPGQPGEGRYRWWLTVR